MHYPEIQFTTEQIQETLIANADAILQHKDRVHGQKSDFYFLELTEMCLAFAHVYTLFPKEAYKTYIQELLQLCVNSLEEDHLEPRLSGGVSGFLWLYHHLEKLELIDHASFPSVKEIERFVAASMERDFEARDYDLLGGFTGKGLALLESATAHRKKKVLAGIVDQLESIAVTAADGTLYWIDLDFDDGKQEVINLGLAHGIPAIIIFLAKVYRLGIARRKTSHLIRRSIAWLLQQETGTAGALYPPYLGFSGASRLAWCYGDLCIAFALLQASEALQESAWRKEAIRIATATTVRKLEDSGVALHPTEPFYDISFCHGTAGLAHMYHRLFQATAIKELEAASRYWCGLTLSMPRDERFLAGYQLLFYDNSGKDILFLENYTLLNGLPGIMLMLAAQLPGHKIAWDAYILTDLPFLPA